MVFVHTNFHRKEMPQYAKSIVVQLPQATNYTPELVKYAKYGLCRIFKKGYNYKKAGVIMLNLTPQNHIQANLFYHLDNNKAKQLMDSFDALNQKFGRDTIRLAAQGYGTTWKLLQEKLSPCYSTRLNDIISVY